MEKMVEELKKIVTFKNDTVAGDIVLVAGKDPELLIYALVVDIEKDPSKRDEWWIVTLFFLTVPPQKAKWILRTSQMTGMEIFTMDGAERFVMAIDLGDDIPPKPQKNIPTLKGGKPGLRVIK